MAHPRRGIAQLPIGSRPWSNLPSWWPIILPSTLPTEAWSGCQAKRQADYLDQDRCLSFEHKSEISVPLLLGSVRDCLTPCLVIGKLDSFRSDLRIRFARQTPKNPHSRGLLICCSYCTQRSASFARLVKGNETMCLAK